MSEDVCSAPVGPSRGVWLQQVVDCPSPDTCCLSQLWSVKRLHFSAATLFQLCFHYKQEISAAFELFCFGATEPLLWSFRYDRSSPHFTHAFYMAETFNTTGISLYKYWLHGKNMCTCFKSFWVTLDTSISHTYSVQKSRRRVKANEANEKSECL